MNTLNRDSTLVFWKARGSNRKKVSNKTARMVWKYSHGPATDRVMRPQEGHGGKWWNSNVGMYYKVLLKGGIKKRVLKAESHIRTEDKLMLKDALA